MFTFIIQHTNHSVIRLRPCPGVPDAPYWVLSTDYHSYSLVYSCSNYFGLFHIDFAWILARTRVLSEQVISELHDELAAAGVNLNRLTVSDQTGCDVMTWGAICKMGKKKGEQTEAEYFELRWKLQVLFVDVVCSADSTQQSVELHKIAVMWIHILLF